MKLSPATSHRQAGVTLFVGLIMLILMTLLALSAIKLANSHLKTVANEQLQQEGQSAAVFALDLVANSPTFAKTTAAKTVTVDVGAANYSVTVAKPYCRRYRVIPTKELVTITGGKPTMLAKDIVCISGSSSSSLTLADTAVAASSAGNSLCAGTVWEVEATAVPATTETQTGVAVVMTQGLEQRVSVPDAQDVCK